jgi:DNA-binding CsgD family transcriptional regulator
MQQAVRQAVGHAFGREAELALLDRFVSAKGAGAGLVLTGGPGVGKTTLWQAGTDLARRHRRRVLATRPGDAETGLSFAGLADLLEGIDTAAIRGVPSPQLRALDVALVRAPPDEVPPESLAISAGFLNVLRGLSSRKTLLVAVDDVNRLDRPSADVLVFAARRLRGSPIRFLLARRPCQPSGLERALEPGLERLEVAPLSLGALRHLLVERLGLNLPRHALRRLVDTTLGNPLFALEVGRVLAEHGLPAAGDELPVPDTVEDLLGTRVASLGAGQRRLLLAVALSADLRASDLAAFADAATIEDAVEAGLLIVDGDRVRVSHPLLAAAARKRSPARDRRRLHLELAGVVADQELRARHLALAATAPADELAATVGAAAASASARGARQEAVELAEHALRLTPPESPRRPERVLVLAGYLEAAGELQRVTDLLTPELASLPPGSPRARAWLHLAEGGHIQTVDDYKRHLERALAESQDDPVLRARVVAKMSSAVIGVERINEAEAEALEVLPLARADPDVERLVLLALAWARSLSGRPIDDLCERFDAAARVPAHMTESPDRVAGQRLVWRGELDKARVTFTRLLTIADERGEAGSYAIQRLHLCELALRAGDWGEAARLLDEWAESSDRDFLIPPMYERCRALLAAGRGVPAEAERWATEAIEGAEAMGVQFDWLEALRARGIAALLAHDLGRAIESLGAVWDHTEREGVDEPGAFPAAPDLVEALVEVHDQEQATLVTDRLRRLAEEQLHPWGLATAARCAGLVQLAAGRYDEQAAATLLEAADAYDRLGLRFDRARTLLSLGRAARRLKKWGAARHALECADAGFDEIGSAGWADQARAELSRVAARKPRAAGRLTPTEERVAGLAADGLSNKEIAATLFVTVHTVEVHLSHAYAKLGVHSRAQLSGRLASRA